MHHLRKLTLLLLAALFALTLVPASAQDDIDNALEDVSQLDGIESAVSRSWTFDVDALLAQTPGSASAEDPLAGIAGTIFLTGLVMEFEGDREAEAAFTLYRDTLAAEFATYANDGEEITESAIDGLGDSAWGIDIHSTADDTEGYYRYLMVQDGTRFFVIVTAATTADATGSADRLAGYLVEDGAASDDDVSFNSDGTSTGGAWDIFPEDGHEALRGLVPAADEVLYPAPDEDA
jgi:hypothetical protein